MKLPRRRAASLALLLLLPLLGLAAPGQAAKRTAARRASAAKPAGGVPILVIDAGGPADRITQMLFTHDSRYLVTAGDDKVVRVWSVETGEAVRALRGQIGAGHEGEITALALSPDDRYLAVGGVFEPKGDVRLYDFRSGQMVALLHGWNREFRTLAFSPDGRLLAGGAHTDIYLWDVAHREQKESLDAKDGVESVAFSPDGTRLVAGGYGNRLRLWNARTGQPIRDLAGHTGTVHAAVFSPDGRSILSGSADGSVRLWNAQTGEMVKDLSPGEAPVHGLALTPDGARLLVRNVPKHACTVLAVPTGEVLLRFAEHDNTVTALAVARNGRVAATAGGQDHEIYLWDLTTGAVLRRLAGAGRPVLSVGIAPDSRSFVFGDTPWDAESNAPEGAEKVVVLSREDEDGAAPGISLHARTADETSWRRAIDRFAKKFETRQVRKKSNGEHARLELLADGKLRREIKRNPHSFTLSPDGNELVVGGSAGSLELYDGFNGVKLGDFVGHSGDVSAVTVSADGKWLLSGSRDQTVRLWNVKQRALRLTLFATKDGEWVAWTPEGYYASSLHGDRYIGWHLNQGPDRAAAYFPASQFAPQFYRPDVVSEYLKDGDVERALVRANARRAPETVTAAAGASLVGVEAILPPRVEVAEPGKDELTVESETLRVRATALSDNLPIEDLRVTVNGLRVAGLPAGLQEGREKGREKGGTLRREVETEVTLKPGENVLTFVATHAKARSAPLTRRVTYRPAPGARLAGAARPNLVLLAIGISDYADPPLKLAWAAEDARQVYEQFVRQEGKLFGHVSARLLPGEGRAGRREILSALDWFAKQGGAGDLRLLFLSGHGALDARRNFYFLSQEAAADDPGLAGVRWSQLLDSLTAGAVRPVLMVDACHAAAAARGPARSRLDLTELVKAFDGLYPSLVTFTASSADEPSVERDEWRHGAFTEALLEGLSGRADGIAGGEKDGRIDTLELSAWLVRRVAELTGNQQHANFDSGGMPPFPLFQVEP